MKRSIVAVVVLWSLLVPSRGMRGDYVGCYQHELLAESGGGGTSNKLVDSAGAADSPVGCVTVCLVLFYKYASILNGQQCFCRTSLGIPANETCTLQCRGSTSQQCGGIGVASVYETGQLAPSPPQSLSLNSRNENSLTVSWRPPAAPNGVLLEYHIVATPVSSYLADVVTAPVEWDLPNTTLNSVLQGLVPGTKFSLALRARTAEGYSAVTVASFSTEIGAPSTPETPVVVKSSNNEAVLQLKPVLPSTGPITKYQLIVINEDAASLGVHDGNKLVGSAKAKAEGLPYYVAAELSPQEFKQEFVVGDGATYGGFLNVPLPEDHEVRYILGVVSSFDGVTKSSFSGASIGVESAAATESPAPVAGQSDQGFAVVIEEGTSSNGDNIIQQLIEESDSTFRPPFRIDKPLSPARSSAPDASGVSRPKKQRPRYNRDPPAVVVGLSVAIGILAFLLVVMIGVYFYLRHRVHRTDLSRRRSRRHGTDRQGLTMHSGSTFELENGYVHSSFVMGLEDTPVDHYESLKQRLWTIPGECLVRSGDVLGTGQYGAVKRGCVRRGETSVEAVLHRIEDCNLVSGQRHAMLKDLAVLVKVGQHVNVASLIGVCEEPETITIAMEFYSINLKELLLNSRALNNYPAYAEKEQRFSTLHEAQAIDIALGITRGMAYLQSLSVPHKRLTSRTIMICDGSVPKILGFGMDFYQPAGQNYDFKRWMAPEALSSPQHAPKCEVWSFAIVLWEIVTLGATPYVDVRCKELAQRVQRGLRLKQLSNIGVSLYQIMVSCWQIDLDERPNFQELFDIMQEAFNHSLDYLSFNLFPDFVYERYDPNIEANR